MRNLNRFLLLFFVSILIAACSGNRVRVLSFTPSGEVEPFTTFQVDFSEALAPENVLNEWKTDEYITFEPALQGKFKWITPNSLIFSPEKPLAAGTDYTAKVNDLVLFGSKEKKSDFETYSFHSPYFDAKSVDFFWSQVPHSDYKVSVQANLVFNYEVDPANLPNFLEVTKGGSKVGNYQILTKEPSAIIALDLGEQQQTEKDQDFKITIKAGLKSPATSRAMADDRSFDVTLPPLTRLAITSVASGFDGAKGWIEVFTTQAIDEEAAKRYIKVLPEKKYVLSTTSNSFRIEAGFEPGSMVELKLKKGMPGLYGGKLEEDYTQSVVMADLSPKLTFASEKGQYLMRGGEENIKVTSVNVSEVEVKIWEVYDNNLLFYLYQNGGGYYSDYCCGASNGYSGDYEGDYEEDYYGDEYYDDYFYGGDVGNYGRLLHSEKIDLGESKNRVNDFTVNLNKHLDKRFRGIYVVEVRDGRDYWRGDVKAVSVSNMGIIAKRSESELMVFVNEISTTNPVSGAEVALISSNNQPLATGRTDAQGVAHFTDLDVKTEGFTPRMIAVKSGEDFNFIDFAETEIGLSRFEVGGKHEYHHKFDTYLYADRNLFRPGESAHFNAIVRKKDMTVVKDLPVHFQVKNPRGKVMYESRKNLGDQGSAEITVELPEYTVTGDYVVDLYTGDKQLLSSYNFSVEDFVPDKIRVEAEADKKIVKMGEELKVDIFSEYLFGTPCSEHRYEVDINLRHQSFTSKKYSSFNFYPSGANSSQLENELGEGKLDDAGKASYLWTAPADLQSSGIVSGRAYVTVFDATGRTVTNSVPFEIHPNTYFTGIKSSQYYVGVNENIRLDMMAVNSQDQALKAFPAHVDIIRYEWRTVLKKNSDDAYFYTSERVAIPVKSVELTINGAPLGYNFKPTTSGSYEVRVSKRGQSTYASTSFYAYGYRSTTSTSFEVDREGRIEIIADKSTYAPGETAKLLFKTPFSGKMLVTVERENVLEHFYIKAENNAASMELPITDKHLPNMFVSATLFRPHSKEQNTPFFVGHGYHPIRVEKSSNRLPVEIIAPERIKPRMTQEIVVKTSPESDIMVTLAVVDEGILQIKNYKSPDPYAYMYANRKLSVSSYDLYEQLLEETVSLGGAIAGGDEEGAKRMNPITAKRFKLLSFWSGERRTNGDGIVRIPVQIPQFNGSARLMAVAYSKQRFGASEKRMTITDDVIVMPAIPRFLSPKDSISMPVSLMNTTTKSGSVTVTVKTTGPLAVSGSSTQKVTLKSKDNKNVKFGLKASNSVGVGKITIALDGMDKVLEEIEIAVRPTSPLVVEEDAGMIKAGESKTIRIPGDFIPSTQNSKLVISKFPALKFAGNLERLVGYPHGCLEQTTSKAFPQLYIQDVVAALQPKAVLSGNPVYFVNEAIRKLQGMQLGNGALGYWPGATEHNWWSSVYAAHFLVEAKKAGFQVSETFLDNLLDFVARKSADKETYNYRTYGAGNKITEEVKARKETIYGLYVLATAGRGDISVMNYFRARPHLLSMDSRYLLAGAYGLMNDWNGYRELLPEAFLAEKPLRESGGSFDSPMRLPAMVLSVLMDVDPTNKQVPGLIRYVSNIKSEGYYSTQDDAWTLLALGKAVGRNSKAKVKVNVNMEGKSLGTYDDAPYSQKGNNWGGKSITLSASGTGSVYYFWNTEGVKASGDANIAEVDNNIKIRRKWYSRQGQALTQPVVNQGDLIVCEIQLTTGIRSVENLAISDLIPAGFEIENPRLTESTSLNWVKTTLGPDYVDVRDDRMLLFTSMPGSATRSYFYMMRAVNAGKFRQAPIGCEAMYDPEFRSYNGAGWVQVKPI